MKTLILILLIFFFPSSDNPDAILGKWNTRDNEGVIEIYKEGQKYFAKLIELKIPNDALGHPRKDSKNKDENLKTRNLNGIIIFWDMEYNSKRGRWEKGKVYDPDMGHTADGFITITDNNTLVVKGFVGFEWISKSQIWKRKKE